MKIYGLCLVITIVALASCSTSTSVNDTAPELTALPSGAWELIAIERRDEDAVAVSDPGRYAIEFRDENAVHIRADCNLCNGNYETQGENLDLGLLACTLAACPPQSLADAYLEALGSATTFELSSDGELLVVYPDGVLRFTRQ